MFQLHVEVQYLAKQQRAKRRESNLHSGTSEARGMPEISSIFIDASLSFYKKATKELIVLFTW